MLHGLAFVAIFRQDSSRADTRDRFIQLPYVMQLIINGQSQSFETVNSLKSLLTSLGIPDDRGVAVAHNSTVVGRDHLSEIHLQEGDHVEIIRATAGG